MVGAGIRCVTRRLTFRVREKMRIHVRHDRCAWRWKRLILVNRPCGASAQKSQGQSTSTSAPSGCSRARPAHARSSAGAGEDRDQRGILLRCALSPTTDRSHHFRLRRADRSRAWPLAQAASGARRDGARGRARIASAKLSSKRAQEERAHTKADAGLPGSPSTSLSPMRANHVGLPGRSATFSNRNLAAKFAHRRDGRDHGRRPRRRQR
jgi:hypothetical protein